MPEILESGETRTGIHMANRKSESSDKEYGRGEFGRDGRHLRGPKWFLSRF